jgi:putative membrane protein
VRGTLEGQGASLGKDWRKLKASVRDSADAIRTMREQIDIPKLLNALERDAKADSNFFAEPVVIETKPFYHMGNYGSQSAPFYTALALWVGAVVWSSVVKVGVDKEEGYSIRELYAGRLLTFITVGVAQAVSTVFGNIHILGADTANPLASVVFACLASAVFMTLVFTVVALFGQIGKGIAIVLLVLSLAAGGGNFPVEMSGEVFQTINPYLPFTHAVNLLREAAGGIYLPTVQGAVIPLAITLIASLLALFIFLPILKPFSDGFTNKVHEAGI